MADFGAAMTDAISLGQFRVPGHGRLPRWMRLLPRSPTGSAATSDADGEFAALGIGGGAAAEPPRPDFRPRPPPPDAYWRREPVDVC